MTKIVPIIAVFLLLLPNGVQNKPIPDADHRRPESKMNSYTTETPPPRSETPETTVLGGEETSTEVLPRAEPEITVIEGNTSSSGYTPSSETPDLNQIPLDQSEPEHTYSFLKTFFIVVGGVLAFILLSCISLVFFCWIYQMNYGFAEITTTKMRVSENPVELLSMNRLNQDELPEAQSST